jgi:hypothetical protein
LNYLGESGNLPLNSSATLFLGYDPAVFAWAGNRAGGTTGYFTYNGPVVNAVVPAFGVYREPAGLYSKGSQGVVNASTILVRNNMGQSIYGAGVAPYTVTLPSIVAIPSGLIINFYNNEVGAMTIKGNGAELINARGLSSNTFVLQKGQSLMLSANGTNGTNWMEVTSNSPGPVFSARNSASQAVTPSIATKVAIDNESDGFDTASCFDTALNRFTPNVAGYYSVTGTLRCTGTAMTGTSLKIYKNGAEVQQLAGLNNPASTRTETLCGSTTIFMNGTTDYLEMWGIIISGAPITFDFNTTAFCCRFSGFLARAA